MSPPKDGHTLRSNPKNENEFFSSLLSPPGPSIGLGLNDPSLHGAPLSAEQQKLRRDPEMMKYASVLEDMFHRKLETVKSINLTGVVHLKYTSPQFNLDFTGSFSQGTDLLRATLRHHSSAPGKATTPAAAAAAKPTNISSATSKKVANPSSTKKKKRGNKSTKSSVKKSPPKGQTGMSAKTPSKGPPPARKCPATDPVKPPPAAGAKPDAKVAASATIGGASSLPCTDCSKTFETKGARKRHWNHSHAPRISKAARIAKYGVSTDVKPDQKPTPSTSSAAPAKRAPTVTPVIPTASSSAPVERTTAPPAKTPVRPVVPDIPRVPRSKITATTGFIPPTRSDCCCGQDLASVVTQQRCPVHPLYTGHYKPGTIRSGSPPPPGWPAQPSRPAQEEPEPDRDDRVHPRARAAAQKQPMYRWEP